MPWLSGVCGKGAAIDNEINIPLEAKPGAKDYSNQKLGIAVEQLNKTMETYNTELRFTIHEESGQILVKVINTRTTLLFARSRLSVS